MSTPMDLQSILQTLATFQSIKAQSQQQDNVAAAESNTPSNTNVSAPRKRQLEDEDEDYEPPDARTAHPPVPGEAQSKPEKLPDPRPTKKGAFDSRVAKPSVDATSIIDWQAGLRHVAILVATNEHLGESIKKMIRNQHENERQWLAARDEIPNKLKGRQESAANINRIISAVGGTVVTEEHDVDERRSLLDYDQKVFRIQKLMVKALEQKLADLGIPFFGTNDALIKRPGSEERLSKNQQSNSQTAARSITVDELLKLQRKMLQYLEDMFKD